MSKYSWEQTSAPQKYWSSLASSTDGLKLAATIDRNGYIYTSSNGGTTWIERTGSGQRNWHRIASSSDGTKLAAVNLGLGIYTGVIQNSPNPIDPKLKPNQIVTKVLFTSTFQ